MVVMDPDTEFNALSALYQSVIADMKASYPAWEVVGQRAVKLSSALKTTVACLAAFNDAIQQVSDLASNLKGASRDVGACVTRLCMRQRALEGRLKSVADALGDELAVGVHGRTAFWKNRTSEMDKTAARHVKKVRGRKSSRVDETTLSTQRSLCKQLLQEQRAQFAFFLSALTPVLTTEVSLLDEASHIRPVVESLENTMKHVDGDTLVHTILSDLTQGADSAWKSCLSSTTNINTTSGTSFSLSSSLHSSDDDNVSRMTSPSMMGTNNCESNDMIDHTPSHHSSSHYSSSSCSFPPPPQPTTASSHLSLSSTPSIPRPTLPPMTMMKPPLGRRLSSTSVPLPPQTPSSLSQSPPDNVAVSSFRSTHLDHRPMRPQSFTGDVRTIQQDGGGGYVATPMTTPSIYVAPSSFSSIASSTGTDGRGQSSQGGLFLPNSSSSSASSSHANSMITETVQLIDRLGSDLEHFCSADQSASNTMRKGGNGAYGEYASSSVTMRDAPVRVRPDTNSMHRGPPPPERRTSQITCATPTAPSIMDTRHSLISSSNSLRTSRQSLSSSSDSTHPTTLVDQIGPAPYNLISTPSSSFRPPNHFAAPPASYGRQTTGY